MSTIRYCVFGILTLWFFQLSALEGLASEAFSATAIIEATNDSRVEHGQAEINPQEQLMQVAQARADEMAATGQFTHTLATGGSAWEQTAQAGYQYQHVGENLAVHFPSVETMIRGWLRSPSHRANLLADTYTDIGIGIAEGSWQGYNGYVVVQLFAAPQEFQP